MPRFGYAARWRGVAVGAAEEFVVHQPAHERVAGHQPGLVADGGEDFVDRTEALQRDEVVGGERSG